MKKVPLRYRIAANLLLANNRWLARTLLELSQQTPYSHIPGYMQRWHLITHPATPGEPGYGTFINKLREFYPFYVRFHHILRADKGRHVHDHPFSFTSIILKGWYTEERMDADGRLQLITYSEGDINTVKVGEYHRITDVSQDGVITLVFHDKKKYDSWGFLVDGERVHWKDYHNAFFNKCDEEEKPTPVVVKPVESKAEYACMYCREMGKLLLTGSGDQYSYGQCQKCGIASPLTPRHLAAEKEATNDIYTTDPVEFFAFLHRFKENHGVDVVFDILKEHDQRSLPVIPLVKRKEIVEALKAFEEAKKV